jgi:hypothetical protein
MCFERIKGLAVAIHAVQDEWRVEETARATLTLKPAAALRYRQLRYPVSYCLGGHAG